MPSKIPIFPLRLQPAAQRDLLKLQKILTRERGHAPSRTDAIATAITEAISRRNEPKTGGEKNLEKSGN